MDKPRAVRIHPGDNVAVAVEPLHEGADIAVDGARVVLVEDIPAGHKLALIPLAPGDAVTKYGFVIGEATTDVAAGGWVHSQNLRTRLSGTLEYRYQPVLRDASASIEVPTFLGYRRANGRVGTRNEVWIVNTVGCVNTAAERIARVASERYAGRVDGVHAFSHPYGCSQLGDDLRNTQAVLAG
ncbi:MAG TPA: UxaA family hydrolase, partial [Longimicrobium sp.]|nr:UxaA family hydrolase [Longimicrobium sp.]